MSLALETRTTSNCCNTSSTNTGGGGAAAAAAYSFQSSIRTVRPFMASMFANQEIGMFSAIGDGGGGGEKGVMDSDSCSSSSIGRNSDASISSGEDDSAENEVQSDLKGPLDTMDSLEDVLPVKKGISSFYGGKSKSFTSLSDASMVSSIKDISKPDDIYSKKRKNMLALTVYLNKLDNNLKRQAGETRGYHAGVPSLVGSSGEDNNGSGEVSNASSRSSSPAGRLPPLCPRKKLSSPNKNYYEPVPERQVGFPPCRSFSLSDLQSVSPSSSSSGSGHCGEE